MVLIMSLVVRNTHRDAVKEQRALTEERRQQIIDLVARASRHAVPTHALNV